MKTTQEIRQIIDLIDQEGEDLTGWEITFISDLIDHPPQAFTKKQADIVQQIRKRRVK